VEAAATGSLACTFLNFHVLISKGMSAIERIEARSEQLQCKVKIQTVEMTSPRTIKLIKNYWIKKKKRKSK